MSIFSQFFRSRDKPVNSTPGASYSFFLGSSSSGKRVTEQSAMKGTMVILDSRDVLHIPGLGFDGLVGYSPIAMAKNAIPCSFSMIQRSRCYAINPE